MIVFILRVKRKMFPTKFTPFESEEEMILKIKSIWKESASNLVEIRKSMKEFPGRLRAIKECNGSSFKIQFG